MLTATYTLVALSVEQTSVRVSLQSLQKLLHTSFLPQAALTQGQVDYACNTLKRLYEGCHWRKLDKFLVPAIRRASHTADPLLHELDALSQDAAEAMAAALRIAGEAALDTEPRVARFCAAVDNFCGALLKRIEREEQELFLVARAAISGETWFAIANQMLAHDAYQQERRGVELDFRPGRVSFRKRVERVERPRTPLPMAH
jgi:hemerythrin-like domain-containing protein